MAESGSDRKEADKESKNIFMVFLGKVGSKSDWDMLDFDDTVEFIRLFKKVFKS